MNPPCPFLPLIDRPRTAADVNAFPKGERGAAFYRACLEYAQSLWQKGFPAQAILQCNRALSVPLADDEPVLREWPLPYQALAWILLNRPADQFIGNPRRHWQHLATRMVEPDKALRTWRAWACWYLSKVILPEKEFPSDLKQIREEGVVEPTFEEIFHHLGQWSPADDLATWQHALKWSRERLGLGGESAAGGAVGAARIRGIAADELPVVVDLARRIWNVCYPGIISQAQIDYMLAVGYDEAVMRREMSERGGIYALIEGLTGGETGAVATPVGYLGLEPDASSGVLFLSKLYLLPEGQGRGLGRLALGWARAQARALGCQVLRLRVNKHNAPAIRAYRRAGFAFVGELCTDIGQGFVMDDYVMECPAEG